MNKKYEDFLLSVRTLEKQHGLYLRASEWFYLTEHEPPIEEGVFAAAPKYEDAENLQKKAEGL